MSMGIRPWLGIGTGVGFLLSLAIWTSQGASAGRDAATALIQAQRDIAVVQEVHATVDPAALRAAEADLLTATTAFNSSEYATASAFALRASRAAQDLLASQRSADNR